MIAYYFFIRVTFYNGSSNGRWQDGVLRQYGIEQANKCMLMAAIAYNQKMLLKFTIRKVQIYVEVMQVTLQALFLSKTSLPKPIYFLLVLLYLKPNCCNN